MQRIKLYFYEELGWGIIFIINTIASAMLYWTLDNFGERELLLQFNLLFGVVYLPWQLIHLRAIKLREKDQEIKGEYHSKLTCPLMKKGLYKAIQVKNLTTQPQAWGGLIGMMWMTAYWASLLPVWIYFIIRTV